MSGSIIGTAGGVISPGIKVNRDDGALGNMLGAIELLRTGAFRVKASSDGITFSNTTSIITNTSLSTPGLLNDDSAPAYARIAGSLGNIGAMVIIAPLASYAQQFELCFEIVSGFSGAVNCRMSVAFGGFQAITIAGRCPDPITAGDQQIRLGGGTNAAPIGTLALHDNGRMNAWVTDNVNTEPAFDINMHLQGSDYVQFRMVCDYTVDSTRNSLDPSPYIVGACIGSEVTQLAMYTANADSPNVGSFACKFGTAKTTGCQGIGLHGGDGSGFFAGNGGTDTLNSREALFPVIYHRFPFMSVTQGGGSKGVSRYFKWISLPHPLGYMGNETAANSREYYSYGDLYSPWPFPSIACLR